MKIKHAINYKKLFTEVQKEAFKHLEDTTYHTPKWYYNFDENTGVYTVTDGHFAVFFNKVMNIVNFDNDACFRWSELNAKKFDEDATKCDFVDVEDTHTTKTMIDGKSCRIFKAGDREIYIDEKLLQYFNLDPSLGVSIKTPDKAFTPIYIYEFGALVGLVLPIKHN